MRRVVRTCAVSGHDQRKERQVRYEPAKDILRLAIRLQSLGGMSLGEI